MKSFLPFFLWHQCQVELTNNNGGEKDRQKGLKKEKKNRLYLFYKRGRHKRQKRDKKRKDNKVLIDKNNRSNSIPG